MYSWETVPSGREDSTPGTGITSGFSPNELSDLKQLPCTSVCSSKLGVAAHLCEGLCEAKIRGGGDKGGPVLLAMGCSGAWAAGPVCCKESI